MLACDLRTANGFGEAGTSLALLGKVGSRSWRSTSCSGLELVICHHYVPGISLVCMLKCVIDNLPSPSDLSALVLAPS